MIVKSAEKDLVIQNNGKFTVSAFTSYQTIKHRHISIHVCNDVQTCTCTCTCIHVHAGSKATDMLLHWYANWHTVYTVPAWLTDVIIHCVCNVQM